MPPISFQDGINKWQDNVVTSEVVVEEKKEVQKTLDDSIAVIEKISDSKEKEIIFPSTLNYSQISARAGNGWDVNLVGILIKHIFKNNNFLYH